MRTFTIYLCHGCGWIQGDDEHAPLSCARCGEDRSQIEEIEVAAFTEFEKVKWDAPRAGSNIKALSAREVKEQGITDYEHPERGGRCPTCGVMPLRPGRTAGQGHGQGCTDPWHDPERGE